MHGADTAPLFLFRLNVHFLTSGVGLKNSVSCLLNASHMKYVLHLDGRRFSCVDHQPAHIKFYSRYDITLTIPDDEGAVRVNAPFANGLLEHSSVRFSY